MGLRPHLWFCAFKTATLASELMVSMGPSPPLWFLHAKQRLWDQNYRSLWISDISDGFLLSKQRLLAPELQVSMGPSLSSVVLCIHNSDIMTRITSLHGSQTSPVLLCMQNNVISIRITSLYGSQPSSVVFACKRATFGSELQVSMGPRLRLLICECKTACLDPEWR